MHSLHAQLKDRNILLCVTGCVAIYKSAELVRKLVHNGSHIKVLMSDSALNFVRPLFFSSLGAEEVFTDKDFFSDKQQILHINLAKWSDVVFVYPATANTIGKLTYGMFDNLLLTTISALPDTTVLIAPGMNTYMLEEPTVVENLNKLAKLKYNSGKNKYIVLDSEHGDLACGDIGKGKIINPESLLVEAEKHVNVR